MTPSPRLIRHWLRSEAFGGFDGGPFTDVGIVAFREQMRRIDRALRILNRKVFRSGGVIPRAAHARPGGTSDPRRSP